MYNGLCNYRYIYMYMYMYAFTNLSFFLKTQELTCLMEKISDVVDANGEISL